MHLVFHVSRLKPQVPNHTPVFLSLPNPADFSRVDDPARHRRHGGRPRMNRMIRIPWPHPFRAVIFPCPTGNSPRSPRAAHRARPPGVQGLRVSAMGRLATNQSNSIRWWRLETHVCASWATVLFVVSAALAGYIVQSTDHVALAASAERLDGPQGWLAGPSHHACLPERRTAQ